MLSFEFGFCKESQSYAEMKAKMITKDRKQNSLGAKAHVGRRNAFVLSILKLWSGDQGLTRWSIP
jgi:hypothetical protein